MDDVKNCLQALKRETPPKKALKAVNDAILALNSLVSFLDQEGSLTKNEKRVKDSFSVLRKPFLPAYMHCRESAIRLSASLLALVHARRASSVTDPTLDNAHLCDVASFLILSGVLDYLDEISGNIQKSVCTLIATHFYPVLHKIYLSSESLDSSRVGQELLATLFLFLKESSLGHAKNQSTLRDPKFLGGARLGHALSQIKSYEALDNLLQLIGLLIPTTAKSQPASQSKRSKFIHEVFEASSSQASVCKQIIELVQAGITADWEQVCFQILKILAASDINFPQPFGWENPVFCATRIKQFPENIGFFIDKRAFFATIQHAQEKDLAESFTIPYSAVREIRIKKTAATDTKVTINLSSIPDSHNVNIDATYTGPGFLFFGLAPAEVQRFTECLQRRGLGDRLGKIPSRLSLSEMVNLSFEVDADVPTVSTNDKIETVRQVIEADDLLSSGDTVFPPINPTQTQQNPAPTSDSAKDLPNVLGSFSLPSQAPASHSLDKNPKTDSLPSTPCPLPAKKQLTSHNLPTSTDHSDLSDLTDEEELGTPLQPRPRKKNSKKAVAPRKRRVIESEDEDEVDVILPQALTPSPITSSTKPAKSTNNASSAAPAKRASPRLHSAEYKSAMPSPASNDAIDLTSPTKNSKPDALSSRPIKNLPQATSVRAGRSHQQDTKPSKTKPHESDKENIPKVPEPANKPAKRKKSQVTDNTTNNDSPQQPAKRPRITRLQHEEISSKAQEEATSKPRKTRKTQEIPSSGPRSDGSETQNMPVTRSRAKQEAAAQSKVSAMKTRAGRIAPPKATKDTNAKATKPPIKDDTISLPSHAIQPETLPEDPPARPKLNPAARPVKKVPKPSNRMPWDSTQPVVAPHMVPASSSLPQSRSNAGASLPQEKESEIDQASGSHRKSLDITSSEAAMDPALPEADQYITDEFSDVLRDHHHSDPASVGIEEEELSGPHSSHEGDVDGSEARSTAPVEEEDNLSSGPPSQAVELPAPVRKVEYIVVDETPSPPRKLESAIWARNIKDLPDHLEAGSSPVPVRKTGLVVWESQSSSRKRDPENWNPRFAPSPTKQQRSATVKKLQTASPQLRRPGGLQRQFSHKNRQSVTFASLDSEIPSELSYPKPPRNDKSVFKPKYSNNLSGEYTSRTRQEQAHRGGRDALSGIVEILDEIHHEVVNKVVNKFAQVERTNKADRDALLAQARRDIRTMKLRSIQHYNDLVVIQESYSNAGRAVCDGIDELLRASAGVLDDMEKAIVVHDRERQRAFDPVRDAVRNSPVTPSADFSAAYNPYDNQQSPSPPSPPPLLSPSLGRRATNIRSILNDDPDPPPPPRRQPSGSLSRILHTEPDVQANRVAQSPSVLERHRDQLGQPSSRPRSSTTEPPSPSPKPSSMSRSRPPVSSQPPPKPRIRYNPRRITPAQSVLVPMTEEEMRMYKSYIGVGAARLKKRRREGSTEADDRDQPPAKKPRDVQAVVSHYNARPDVGVAQRQHSPIYGLKSFNNWVKSVLIMRFAHPALANGVRRGGQAGKVLEMGCGKGGDLQKWQKARIRELVAVDIASVSVNQAEARWASNRRYNNFDATFGVLDCYVDSLASVIPTAVLSQPFDVVSMQFCMHYAFETETKARCMLENVTRWLRPGGVFLGTIPNSEQLLSNLNDLPPDTEDPSFGNSVYKIRFADRHRQPLYGHKYWFYLTDAVDDVPEYIVHWDNFVELASEYGLHPTYHAEFHQFFEEHQEPEHKKLMERMNVVDSNGESSMDEDQWEAANIYVAFAFEKIRR